MMFFVVSLRRSSIPWKICSEPGTPWCCLVWRYHRCRHYCYFWNWFISALSWLYALWPSHYGDHWRIVRTVPSYTIFQFYSGIQEAPWTCWTSWISMPIRWWVIVDELQLVKDVILISQLWWAKPPLILWWSHNSSFAIDCSLLLTINFQRIYLHLCHIDSLITLYSVCISYGLNICSF